MANPEHVAIVKQGAEAIRKWQEAHPKEGEWLDLTGTDFKKMAFDAALVRMDFNGANLSKANFERANLSLADLSGATLNWALLSGADLSEALLSGATLNWAALSMADLSGADLRRADLSGANLWGTNLSGADLSGATLSKAALSGTILAATNLTATSGLDTCQHSGPSTLDHRTLARSSPLPLAFLRGCGLPEALIEYLPSLLNEAIQYYSCFISYSSKDQEFAERLHADLQNKGVRCWFAPHDVQAGRKLHEQIDQAIRLHERLLLILSTHSMASEWVKTEIAKARQREVQEKRQVLFPVSLVPFAAIRAWECFDADTGKDSAREIREYFIPDFSDWKNHDAYQPAFARLLRDLKEEAPLAAGRTAP